MKFIVLCTFLILAVYNTRAALSKEDVIKFANECKEEAGASDADFEALKKHESLTSKEGKCMSACFFKKLGVISEEGKMVKEVAIKMTKHVIKDEDKKDQAEEIIAACEDLNVSEDHCEAAEEYGQCVKAEFKSRGISPFKKSAD